VCNGRYRNPPHGLAFDAGDVIDDAAVILFLLSDAPDCFSVVDDDALELGDEMMAVYESPAMYDRKVLRHLGVALGIDGAAGMNKVPLVRAIKKFRQQKEDGIPF
jgi:hypothetical protein